MVPDSGHYLGKFDFGDREYLIFARPHKMTAWWSVQVNKEGNRNLSFTHKTVTIEKASPLRMHASIHTCD